MVCCWSSGSFFSSSSSESWLGFLIFITVVAVRRVSCPSMIGFPGNANATMTETTATITPSPAVPSSRLSPLTESLKLEHQLLRVPFEHYKKTIRVNHPCSEKEVSTVVSSVGDLADSDWSKDDTVSRLTILVSRLQGLKRKVIFPLSLIGDDTASVWIAGADPTAQDSQHGRTTLHTAAMANNLELVRVILDAGVSTNIQNARLFSSGSC